MEVLKEACQEFNIDLYSTISQNDVFARVG